LEALKESVKANIFLFIWSTLMGLAVLSIILKTLKGRAHRRRLVGQGRTRSLDQLSREELEAGYFLATNSPFGFETWWIPKGTEPIPMTDGTYEQGLLITPNPHFKSLQRFCKEHGIKLEMWATKFVKRQA